MNPAPPRGRTPTRDPVTMGRSQSEDRDRAILYWFSTTVPVVLVAVVIAPLVVAGGTLVPWQPVMPELGTMIAIATQMVDGQVVFGTSTTANFSYTPFATLLIAPLALSGPMLWQVVLLVASVSALQHLLVRLFGWEGPQLVLAGSLVVIMVEPVRTTLGVGQLSLLVLLLIVGDLIESPHPGKVRGRLLPQGTLTGVAAGIAVAPGWVLVSLLLAGRRRVALTGLAAGMCCALLGWIVMPGQSESLLAGASRSTFSDAVWASNQSLVAALVRLGSSEPVAQVGALLVALAGAWVGARWWRTEPMMALGLVLSTSLMPRDPAWTWQFVGVLVVASGVLHGVHRLPRMVTAVGVLWVLWTSLALPQLFSSNDPVPSTLEVWLGGVGPLVLVLLVGAMALTAPRMRRAAAGSWPRVRSRSVN